MALLSQEIRNTPAGVPHAPTIRLKEVPCPRCAGQASTPIHVTPDFLHGVAGTFTMSACNGCGFWFQNPRPVDEDISLAYPAAYQPHQTDKSDPLRSFGRGTLRFLKERWGYEHLDPQRGNDDGIRGKPFLDPLRSSRLERALVPRFVPGGHLLEIGSANGSAMRRLLALGWTSVVGIEPVAAAAAKARSSGLQVHEGTAEDVLPTLPAGAFDSVYSTMVLEHLKDPFGVLAQAGRVLKPGGQLLVSTIFRDSHEASRMGPYWAGLDLPRHLCVFTRQEIHQALQADFRRIRFFDQTAPIDYHRARTARRGAAARHHPLADLTRARLAAAMHRSCRVSVRAIRRGPETLPSEATGGPST